ncbi:unnamed protein product, partial [Iphiclides podalirius]
MPCAMRTPYRRDGRVGIHCSQLSAPLGPRAMEGAIRNSRRDGSKSTMRRRGPDQLGRVVRRGRALSRFFAAQIARIAPYALGIQRLCLNKLMDTVTYQQLEARSFHAPRDRHERLRQLSGCAELLRDSFRLQCTRGTPNGRVTCKHNEAPEGRYARGNSEGLATRPRLRRQKTNEYRVV